MNCLNAIEDLITHYSEYFADRCNLTCAPRDSGICTPAVVPCEDGWFNDAPVFYIHPTQASPEVKLSHFKNDVVLLEIQRHRVLGRMEAAFGRQHQWFRDNRCQAPTYAQVEGYRGTHCSLLCTSGSLDEVCRRFDTSFGLPPSSYDILKAADVSLNAATILRDLVASALANGVEFDTGVTIENLVLDRFGTGRITSLLCRGQQRMPLHLKAKLFVFAVGAGFDRYAQELRVSARLKISHSAMVVAWPALFRLNFARMSIKPKFHFNHLVQHGVGKQGPFQFSMLANSAFSDQDAHIAEKVADIDAILDAAERYFGRKALHTRRLYTYECAKAEFLCEEEEKRRYSYWIEHPRDTNYIGVLPASFPSFRRLLIRRICASKSCCSSMRRCTAQLIALTPRGSNGPRRWWPIPMPSKSSQRSSTGRPISRRGPVRIFLSSPPRIDSGSGLSLLQDLRDVDTMGRLHILDGQRSSSGTSFCAGKLLDAPEGVDGRRRDAALDRANKASSDLCKQRYKLMPSCSAPGELRME